MFSEAFCHLSVVKVSVVGWCNWLSVAFVGVSCLLLVVGCRLSSAQHIVGCLVGDCCWFLIVGYWLLVVDCRVSVVECTLHNTLSGVLLVIVVGS
jgi:hypothetical protein